MVRRTQSVANEGRQPTSTKRESQSIINATVCSENLLTHVSEWRVLEQESLLLSDHKYIVFHVTNEQGEIKPMKPGWKIKPSNMENFDINIVRLLEDHQSDNANNIDADKLNDIIRKACDLAFP